jgi:hypothetical protein
MVGNLIKEYQRRRLLKGKHFREGADLEIPVSTMNFFDLTQFARRVNEFT